MSFDLDTTGWHKWFAIYPVYLNCGKLTWLKTVYRNGTVVHGRKDGCASDVWVWEYAAEIMSN